MKKKKKKRPTKEWLPGTQVQRKKKNGIPFWLVFDFGFAFSRVASSEVCGWTIAGAFEAFAIGREVGSRVGLVVGLGNALSGGHGHLYITSRFLSKG
jgi:hypothetical protein